MLIIVSYRKNGSGVQAGSGRNSKILASVSFDGRPCFFSLEIINRNNSAEEYKFRLLLVEQGQFWLNEIQHCYRIEPGKGQLTLQLEDNELRIAELGDKTCLLDEESDDVDCRHYALVNFETLANQSELIKFNLISGDSRLLFNIEGPGAEDGLTLPLLLIRVVSINSLKKKVMQPGTR